MGFRHASLPIDGVQFHPESVLTQGGHRIVANWASRCGASVDDAVVERLAGEVETMRAGAFVVG
jgi:para-aminobenzoate synthetase component 2